MRKDFTQRRRDAEEGEKRKADNSHSASSASLSASAPLRENLDPFGCYRVIDPPGSLPQNCWKLDNDPRPRPGETAVRVEILNVDSSSFRQMEEQSLKEGQRLEDLIAGIVQQRGKLHNPVTGSGGMLLGVLADGRRIATLVSLTLTPLQLDSIQRVDRKKSQLHVQGQAILFERTLWRHLPTDFPETVSLAALDVAGAPARCARLCRQARRVLLLGAGKAGLLTAAAVRLENPAAHILAVDRDAASLDALLSLGLCDWQRRLDASQPLQVYRAIEEATQGQMADLTVNMVNCPGTEGASILATRDQGAVYFFSMATSFSQAALTAEGVARDVDLHIGTGYTAGWADYALGLLRGNKDLRRHFEGLYGES